MTDRFVDVGGAALRVRQRLGTGTPVFWLHEFGGSVESWTDLWSLLPGPHPFFAHDLRGSGLSEKLRGHPRIEGHVDDLAALLDLLAPQGPVVLAGCAVGAAVALGLAAAQPARVAGVLALAPALGVAPAVATAVLARAQVMEQSSMRDAVQASMDSSWPRALRTPPERFQAYAARWLGNDPGSYAAGLRLISSMDPLPWLPRVRCPVRVVAGRLDTNRTPAQIAEKMAPAAGAELTVIEAGHFMAAQAPELLAPVAGAFLRQVAV